MAEANAMTEVGLEALRKEVEELESTGRNEIAARIKTAREWGDLKENAEYHDAKNSQAMLERKITLLRAKLDHAVVVENAGSDGKVAFGSTVQVIDEETGKSATYTLVGEAEASAAEGKISAESPVGRALQGHKPGEVAVIETPRGERRLKVEKVS